jgi:sugar phosphate isomerase/epimerase
MPEPIALQLWTVRELYDRDPRGVIARVAELGYPAMEMVHSRTGGLTHAQQQAALEASGLRACSLHCFYDELESELDAVLEAAQTFGVEHVVCAWVDADRRRDAEDYRALASALARAGERCRERGLRLAYHHHDFELAEFGGRRGMDWIWDGVPAELLVAEVDVYWVQVAGLDLVEYLSTLGPRVELLHLKDRLPAGRPPLAGEGEGLARWNAEVGEGVIDIPGALAAAPSARWYVTEQDFCAGDPYDSARVSLANLRAMLAAAGPS